MECISKLRFDVFKWVLLSFHFLQFLLHKREVLWHEHFFLRFFFLSSLQFCYEIENVTIAWGFVFKLRDFLHVVSVTWQTRSEMLIFKGLWINFSLHCSVAFKQILFLLVFCIFSKIYTLRIGYSKHFCDCKCTIQS